LTSLFEGNPITQGHEILWLKARVLGAAHNEDFVILGVTVLIQCQGVTDGRTDERTDTSTMAKTRKALHAVARKNGTEMKKTWRDAQKAAYDSERRTTMNRRNLSISDLVRRMNVSVSLSSWLEIVAAAAAAAAPCVSGSWAAHLS